MSQLDAEEVYVLLISIRTELGALMAEVQNLTQAIKERGE